MRHELLRESEPMLWQDGQTAATLPILLPELFAVFAGDIAGGHQTALESRSRYLDVILYQMGIGAFTSRCSVSQKEVLSGAYQE